MGWRFFRVLAVMACITQSMPVGALKFAPAEPDPWYSPWIQIESQSLPPGVAFKAVSFGHERYGYFANAGSTPFYLVTRPAVPPTWVRDLPSTFLPDRMAVSGVAHRLDQTRVWSPVPSPGILIEHFLKQKPGQDGLLLLHMPAYLGKQRLLISGRYFREERRLELDAPLPSPLRVAEVRAERGRFAIANDGAVPLYTGVEFRKPVGWTQEVPYGFLAVYKIVRGRTYQGSWGSSDTADGWHELPSQTAFLTVRELPLHVPGFESMQVKRDNRPARVAVPQPQAFEMTAFHGSKPITVRGRVLYDLNLDYDPQASQGPPACMSCTGEMCEHCRNARRSAPAKRPPAHPPMY